MPCTLPGSRSTVMTVTPVAKLPITRRKSSGVRDVVAMADTFQDITRELLWRGGVKVRLGKTKFKSAPIDGSQIVELADRLGRRSLCKKERKGKIKRNPRGRGKPRPT